MRQGVRPGWWGAGLTLALLAGCAGPGRAAGPPPRALTAARAAADLERRIRREATAGKFDQAGRLAREAAALAQRWRGEKHWQTADARREAQRWQRLAALTEKERAEVTRAYALLA